MIILSIFSIRFQLDVYFDRVSSVKFSIFQFSFFNSSTGESERIYLSLLSCVPFFSTSLYFILFSLKRNTLGAHFDPAGANSGSNYIFSLFPQFTLIRINYANDPNGRLLRRTIFKRASIGPNFLARYYFDSIIKRYPERAYLFH